MMQDLHCRLHIQNDAVKLLVTTPTAGDLLKARLSPRPAHPRALLTLLEGLSLWSGQILNVALYVDEDCRRWLGSGHLGEQLWPPESPLVQFDVACPGRQWVRLSGLGDFREMRRGMP